MIAKAAPKRRAGAGSFSDLKQYLERDELGQKREDCLATWSRGVASHETADLEMEQTVSASRYKGSDPVYHLITSWRPGETIDLETAKRAEQALLLSLGAEGHQSFSALHYDAENDRFHLHTGISKINPTTGKTLPTWQDYAKLERGAEWCERELGLQIDRRRNWRAKVGERDFDFEREEDGKAIRGIDRERTGTIEARDARARTHYSWTEIMRRDVAPHVAQALEKPHARWADIHAALRPYGVELQPAGSGYRVVGAERGQHLKASTIGIDAQALNARLGAFTPAYDHLPYPDRLALVIAPAKEWKTWDGAHRDLAAADLAIRDLGGGRGQVIDLVRGGERRPVSAALGESLPALEARLGPYTPAPALVAIDAREAARQTAGIIDRAAMIGEDPGLILGPLANTQSTWERDDIERAISIKLGIGKGDEHGAIIGKTTEAVIEKCVAIDSERGIYSTPEIQAEEHAMFDAATTLYDRTNAPRIRAAADDLDAQQRRAYGHLASDRQFAIVTGVAGAGKSRLQRDLAAAYREAGARVLGVAVSGEAARTLGSEAEIQSRTVAKLLSDLESGREQLHARDVLLLDEAGTIGTAQAHRLFEHAAKAGATVRVLGDESQHEAVARGAVLRGLAEDFKAYDMASTRRAQHDWLREVARDLRAGKVAPALDALRKNGAIHAYRTQDEAKEYLVSSYVASIEKTVVEQGKERAREAILLADRNVDMNAMNVMVQERLDDAGRLGAAASYGTNFGPATFHENDLVAIREGKDCANGSKWVNGDRAEVLAHLPDGRMTLRRERDGAEDIWDPRENGAIQLGYAMTSYRAQGKTVDDVFVLPAEGRRGTYVDVTRARDSVTIAYGEDRVRDFGALMFQAQKDQGKTLVRDAERVVTAREQSREAERQRAIDRAKAPTKSRSHDGTGRARGHERGFGPDMQR